MAGARGCAIVAVAIARVSVGTFTVTKCLLSARRANTHARSVRFTEDSATGLW